MAAIEINADIQCESVVIVLDKNKILCELREMEGGQRDDFVKEIRQLALEQKKKDDEVIDCVQPLIISKCLWRHDENRFFTIEEIRRFSSSSVVKLYKKATELNAVDEGGKEAEKKDLNQMELNTAG